MSFGCYHVFCHPNFKYFFEFISYKNNFRNFVFGGYYDFLC